MMSHLNVKLNRTETYRNLCWALYGRFRSLLQTSAFVFRVKLKNAHFFLSRINQSGRFNAIISVYIYELREQWKRIKCLRIVFCAIRGFLIGNRFTGILFWSARNPPSVHFRATHSFRCAALPLRPFRGGPRYPWWCAWARHSATSIEAFSVSTFDVSKVWSCQERQTPRLH